MANHLGDYVNTETLYIGFATYDSNGASVTLTGLAVTDIEIYKDGSVTQRSSDAGYTLLDTDGIDFDTTTGIHGFSVDLSDNTDAGFYAAGSKYWLVVNAITVDSQTVRFIYTFDIVDPFTKWGAAYMGPRGPGVYLDDAVANTTSVLGVDGTLTNPNSTIASAKTTADALGVDRIYIRGGTAVTLAATMEDYEFVGIGVRENNTVALASQDVDRSVFFNLRITGVQGGTARAHYEDCEFGTATIYCVCNRCGFTDNVTGVTLANQADNILDQCYSMVAGNSTPIFIGSGANLDASFRHYSGGIELKSLNATATISIETDGQVIFNADCNVNCSVTLRGMLTITDNTAGMNSLTYTATSTAIQSKDGSFTYDPATDSIEAIRDRGDAAWTTGAGGSDRLLMVDTTIATLASQTSFTLTAGSTDDDAYNGCTIVIEDVSTSTQKAIGIVDDYTGSTKTITLLEDPGVFVIAATDKVYILAEKGLKPTTAANYHVDVSANGNVGIDWGNVDNPTTAVDLSATDIQLCDTITTYTGNTVQTGDSFARLGAPAGASVSADIATVDSNVDAILVDTAEIGTAGAGLTAIPWNASWDAEVQSEVNDGLVAIGLDHLMSAAVTGTDVTDNSVIAFLVSSSATADWDSFVNTTDSLQAIRDNQGGAAPTAAAIADAVWDEAQADHVAAGSFGEVATEVASILVDTAEIGAAGAGLTEAGGTGDQLTAIPWNAAWDAEVQSEVNDGLVAVGLDHLVSAAVTGTDITDNSIIAKLVSSSATADWDSYVNTTDSLQALRDHVGDGTNLTEAGGTGDHLTAIAWNAAWDAEVQSEVTDALNAYDPPTRAELTTDTNSILTRLGTPAGADIAADLATIDTVVDTISTNVSALNDISVADVLTTAMTESYGTDGSAITLAQGIYLILGNVAEFAISSTTKTVKQLDGTTTAATYTLDDADNPTSITRAT